MKKQCIIYGGAFNPPTLAHQTILKTCSEYAQSRGAELWLLPSGTRKDKTIATSRELRLRLIEALCLDAGQSIRIVLDEFDRSVPTETIDTVMQLCVNYPDYEFTWVFGSDSYLSMPSWRKGDWLQQNLRMLIVPRDTAPLECAPRNCEMLAVPDMRISSTMVRDAIAAERPYDHLVSPAVHAILSQT